MVLTKECLILKDLGAIGEINGLCFDEKGSIIEINDSLFPTTYLPTFRDNKPIVAVGGGAFRAKALKAAIEGKLINGLITDELTAKMILNQ